MVTDQTTFIVEAYYANQTNVSTISEAGNGRWNGVAAYVVHDFTDQWGLRVREKFLKTPVGQEPVQEPLILREPTSVSERQPLVLRPLMGWML